MRCESNEANGYIHNSDLIKPLTLNACFIPYKKVVQPLLISEEFDVKYSPSYWLQSVHYVRVRHLRSKCKEHVEIKLLSRIVGTCVPQALSTLFFLSDLWFSRKLSFGGLRKLEC